MSGRMSELKNQVNYTEFLDEILRFDTKIRFVAIYDGQLKAKFRNGVLDQFKEAEIKFSLSEALKIRSSRNQMNFNSKKPKFAMAHYDEINQITIPLGEEEIVLLTTELNLDIHKLINKIIEFRNRFFR